MEISVFFGFFLLVAPGIGADKCESKHACKLESLGCFTDTYQRAMPEEILNERDQTSKVFGGRLIDWHKYNKFILGFACRCAKIASAKGYTVIGLQFYGECWSGPNAHKTYNRFGRSTKCIDGKFRPYAETDTSCGRHIGRQWTNHVYRVRVEECGMEDIEPIGCFHDDLIVPRPVPNYIQNERDYTHKGWNGHLIDWENWYSYSSKMICRCATAAKLRGDDYFAIQFWGECWSGKEADVHYHRNGVSDHCRDEDFKKCRCNSYNCVGMAYTNYVYRIHPHKCK